MGTLGAHKMQKTVSQDWYNIHQYFLCYLFTLYIRHCLVLAHTVVDTEPLLGHNFGSTYTGVPVEINLAVIE